MGKAKDLTGKRFGRLVVIERAEDYIRPNGQHAIQWRCKCDCGNEKITNSYSLTKGKCTSCGCARTERLVKMNETHGQSNSSIYRRCCHIKERCRNSNSKNYANYGGRGIEMCDEWYDSFEAFYKWSMAHGYKEELTIDRIDVNGNYCPENCRWATWEVQDNNRRNNHYIKYKGETKTLKQWCDILGLDYKKTHNRLNKLHWSVERAFGDNK